MIDDEMKSSIPDFNGDKETKLIKALTSLQQHIQMNSQGITDLRDTVKNIEESNRELSNSINSLVNQMVESDAYRQFDDERRSNMNSDIDSLKADIEKNQTDIQNTKNTLAKWGGIALAALFVIQTLLPMILKAFI